MITLNFPACGEPVTDETLLGANVKLAEHMRALPELAHVEQLPLVTMEVSRLLGEPANIQSELYSLVVQFDARLRGIQVIAAMELTRCIFSLKSLLKTCTPHLGIRQANRADALQRQLGEALRTVEQKIK